MVLTPQEESLISVIRQLPPEQVVKVFQWAHELRELAPDGAIQGSDSRDDEDMADATRAFLRRFEGEERERILSLVT